MKLKASIILAALLSCGAAVAQSFPGSLPPGGEFANPTASKALAIPSLRAYQSATDYGMKAGGQDNSPYVAALMASNGGAGGGQWRVFPATPNEIFTYYYFSQPLSVSRNGKISCSGGRGPSQVGVALVFAAGVSGVVHESANTAPDGIMGRSALEGCTIWSLGQGKGYLTAGSQVVTGVTIDGFGDIPAQPFQAGDGIIAMKQFQPTTLGIPAGAYIDSATSDTVTVNASFPVAESSLYGPIWRLPVSQRLSYTVTTGSNTVTIVGGTRLVQPGDVLWSDAFPFGATVRDVSGTAGAQTLHIFNVWLTLAQNATKTYTVGSPGYMWIVPAGIDRRTQSRTYGNTTWGFPIGLKMACSSASGFNCTTSYDTENMYTAGLVGRWVSGNNSGASTSHVNIYSKNSIVDIMEGATIGSFYSGDNSNSAEGGTALPNEGVIGNCGNQNYSTFIGMYVGGEGKPYCMNISGNIVDPPVANPAQSSLWIGPQATSPTDAHVIDSFGNFANGLWAFPGGSNPCFSLNNPSYVWGFGSACSTSTTFGMAWNATTKAWEMSYGGTAANLLSFDGAAYTGHIGDGGAYVRFARGFLVSSGPAGSGGAAGTERLFDFGASAPTGVWHKRGDTRINAAPLAGANVGWTYLADGGSPYPFGPISNSTGGGDYTIPVLRSGASGNKDITGRVALTAGAATYNLTGSYVSAPNCLCADVTTPANACAVTESTTQLTFAGTGTDTVKWICIGRN